VKETLNGGKGAVCHLNIDLFKESTVVIIG
jgi:hypothetical protein